MWVAVIVAIFSYLSIEMIAVAAGEAEDPQRAIDRAFRSTVARLVIFYLLTMAIILAIVPWTEAGKGQSPFVTVMARSHVPLAAGGGEFRDPGGGALRHEQPVVHHHPDDVQPGAGRLRAAAIRRAERARNAGFGAAVVVALVSRLPTVLNVLFPDTAFTLMVAISIFGALFTWMMIFVTHLYFRRAHGGKPLAFPHVGLSVCQPVGRRVDGGDSADHGVHQRVPHDPGLWLAGAGPVLPWRGGCGGSHFMNDPLLAGARNFPSLGTPPT